MTVPLILAEGAVNSVLAYVKANYPALLDAVNQHFSDDGLGIICSQPDQENSYTTSEWNWRLAPPLPAIAIVAESSSPVTDLGGGLEVRHAMSIYVADADPSQDTLRRKLRREAAAMVQCLYNGHRAGAIEMYWRPGEMIQYGAVLLRQDQTMFADAHLVVDITTRESY